MKIIVSHDVDHLYITDHIFRDMFLEKFLIRSFIQLLKKRISTKTFLARIKMFFKNRMNRIFELMIFDKENNIPSVFFFGMKSGLGMSYSKETAKYHIKEVIKNGFEAGVHGIDFQSREAMKAEFEAFKSLSNMETFGIRNHYVRYDENTFSKMEKVGYAFDSTWFDKECQHLRNPFKIGEMWEFPLHIMDIYTCEEGKLGEGLAKAIALVERAEKLGIDYCTILFHDSHFDEYLYPDMRSWYMALVAELKKRNYVFISYKEAIKELEKNERN